MPGLNIMMEETSKRLSGLLVTVPVKLKGITEPDWEFRHPNKWSRKEILGHLIDSACNNQQRFLKAQFEILPFKIEPYKQNILVVLNAYQEKPVGELISLWEAMNKQILHLISKIPDEKLENACETYDQKELVTLNWLIEDYVEHMEHHLKQILGPEL